MNFSKEIDKEKEIVQAIDHLRKEIVSDYELIKTNKYNNNLSNLLKKSQILDKLIIEFYK